MKAAVARAIYSTALRLATPWYLARLWWRGAIEPAYRRHWRERLGGGRRSAAPGALWLHAVSLGETNAAAPLVDALRQRRPGLRLLLTHGTATGREAGKALMRQGDLQVWLPYDTPGAVRRFLGRHRPALGVLMETEVWPNLLHQARQAGVPVLLANARLSDRSARKARRWAWLLRPAASSLVQVLAQTSEDAARLSAAGARQVQVCGNLKFDQSPSAALVEQGAQWRLAVARPVVLAASTRNGEEAALLRLWAALPSPQPLLVLVPRHPQRFDEVADLVRQSGLQLRRRSEWAGQPPADAGAVDVWLGDSMGEMPLYYGLVDVALLGGSFEPLGGQNLIEAAACGCPLVMGPHTFNFAEAAERSLAAGASIRVADMAQAVEKALSLAADPARRQWVERALAFSEAHRGAAARMAEAILAHWPAD